MKALDKFPSLKQPSLSSATPAGQSFSVHAEDITAMLRQITNIEGELCLARDLACLYANTADAASETAKAISIDTQALCRTMVFLTARMENAIEALANVQAMISLLDKKID